MGRKNPSLQHELIKRVLPQIENNLTGTAYKKHIKKFASWARENGYRKLEDITKETIQEYEKHLENAPKKYTPATIHTYLSPVCSAAGIRMEEIKKPRRTAGSISRGRDRDVTGKKVVKNKQGKLQECDQKFARLTTLQKAVGVRRSELGKLVGADLIQRGNSWYVRIRRGKGGKAQLQFILPKDVPVVKAVFEGVADDQKVFSREEYVDLYLARKKRTVVDTTYAGYLYRSVKIKEFFRKLKLKDITQADVEQFLDHLFSADKCQMRTVKDIKVLFNGIMEQAVKDGLIADNPVKDAMINKSLALRNAKVKDDDDFFSYREAQLFLEKVESHKLYELFFVTLFFGLRREEVLGLRWSSVDLKAKTLRVNHTVTVGTRVNRLNSTKTDTSNRTYPLTDDQVKMFEHLKAEEIKNRELFGGAYKDNDYIFKNEDGSLHYPDYPSKQFKKVIKENPDLPQRTTFHGLRTSCVSILVHENFDVKGIQKWVGHKDINTTLKIYAKVKEKEAKEEILHGMTSIIRPKSYD